MWEAIEVALRLIRHAINDDGPTARLVVIVAVLGAMAWVVSR